VTTVEAEHSPIRELRDRLQTSTGRVVLGTSAVGVLMGAHWAPMAGIMVIFFLVTLFVPTIARQGTTWMFIAGIWAIAVVIRRNLMEDHVYLYVAWLVAVGVSLLTPTRFIDEAGRHARHLIAIVFGFATFWKLISGSFVSGAALWTSALLDDRMRPVMRMIGISGESFDQARPDVIAVARGDQASFPLDLSSFSSFALIVVAVGTVLLEGAVAVTHAAPEGSRLASIRSWTLIVFGVITYAIVPVLPFVLLLALLSGAIVDFERRTMIGFGVLIAITVLRVLTL